MRDLPTLALTCAIGLLLGALFFGGLWWTIRRAASSTQPALWFFGSVVARMGVTLAGFYFASGGRWERLISCLLGFVIASLLVTWLTKPTETEATHAPHAR